MYLIDLRPSPLSDLERIREIPGVPLNLKVIRAADTPYDELHRYLQSPALFVAAAWENSHLDVVICDMIQTRGANPWSLILFIGDAPPLAFDANPIEYWRISTTAVVLNWPSEVASGEIIDLFATRRLQSTDIYVKISDITLARRANPA